MDSRVSSRSSTIWIHTRKHCISFVGTRKDRFKALYWDGDGFLLLYKRLENGHLQWPTNQLAIRRLDPRQLVRLLSGWALDSTVHKVCPPGH